MFFTHDNMTTAIKHLHPQFEAGRDFMVFMGIYNGVETAPDGSVPAKGTPASDAWIEGWPDGVAVPTLQQLKDAYQAALLVPPTPAPPATRVTPLVFLERFTEAEQLAIVTATMQVPQVKLWYDKLIAATEVVFADPRLAAGLDFMVAQNLITQARSEEVLPLSVRTTGMQQV